jgi:hypothetical protein
VAGRTAAEESMSKRDGQQKGPQQHAEGQHGELTHARFLEQLHGEQGDPEETSSPDAAGSSNRQDQDHGQSSNSGRNGQRG